MRIWRFAEPDDYSFARAGLRGAWSPEEDGPQHRVQPLIIEWLPDSDVVGDFTCTGFDSDWVVTEKVGEMLLERFNGFELGPVEMIQDPKLKRTRQITRRGKTRVWLPYEGPPLYEIWVTTEVEADMERSTLKVTETDPETGAPVYDIEGAESVHVDVDPRTYQVVTTRIPRVPGKGIYVAEAALARADIFHRGGVWIFCTDPVRDFIVEQQFTNVDFFEMGETF
jgi:hypothetical protein